MQRLCWIQRDGDQRKGSEDHPALRNYNFRWSIKELRKKAA